MTPERYEHQISWDIARQRADLTRIWADIWMESSFRYQPADVAMLASLNCPPGIVTSLMETHPSEAFGHPNLPEQHARQLVGQLPVGHINPAHHSSETLDTLHERWRRGGIGAQTLIDTAALADEASDQLRACASAAVRNFLDREPGKRPVDFIAVLGFTRAVGRRSDLTAGEQTAVITTDPQFVVDRDAHIERLHPQALEIAAMTAPWQLARAAARQPHNGQLTNRLVDIAAGKGRWRELAGYLAGMLDLTDSDLDRLDDALAQNRGGSGPNRQLRWLHAGSHGRAKQLLERHWPDINKGRPVAALHMLRLGRYPKQLDTLTFDQVRAAISLAPRWAAGWTDLIELAAAVS